jgi:hypothetical protein
MIADSSGGDAKKRKAIIKQEGGSTVQSGVVHVAEPVTNILTSSNNFVWGYDSSAELGVGIPALPPVRYR